MKKNRNIVSRIVLNCILTAITIVGVLLTLLVLKDFLWGTIEGLEGISGIVVFPLAIIFTGVVIVICIFNLTSLIFCLDAYQKEPTGSDAKKKNLIGIIVSLIGVVIAIGHVIFMFIELIIKR